MSKSTHKEWLEDSAKEIERTMNEIVTSGDYTAIKDVEANKDYSQFTMVVDRKAFENSFDGFAALTLGFLGMFYQLLNGASPDDYEVVVNIEDESTGEVVDTVTYPDALEAMEEETK